MTAEQNEELEQKITTVDRHIADGEVEKAIAVLFETIRQHPDYAKTYNYLGWIFETKQRRYDDAEELYRKSISLKPEYAAPHLNLLYLLNSFQRGEEAAKEIDTLLSLPNVAKFRLYKEWAFMLEYTGKLETSIAKLKEAIVFAVSDHEFEQIEREVIRVQRKIDFLKKA